MRPQQADQSMGFDRLYMATCDRTLRTLTSPLGAVAAAEGCAQDAFLNAFKAWRTWKSGRARGGLAARHRDPQGGLLQAEAGRPASPPRLHQPGDSVALGVPESTVAAGVVTARRTRRAPLEDSEPAVSDTSAPWRVLPIE